MDKSDFTRLYLESEATLYRVSKSILKNEFDCADAVQGAILKAFKKLHTLREEKYFKTWLCRILIRECYRILETRKNSVSFEDYLQSEGEPSFEHDEHRDIGLYTAIMQLSEKHRVVITLHYVEGFKISEISKMLKLPEGTVKSRLSRAKADLRGILQEEEEECDNETQQPNFRQCVPGSV